MVEDDDDDEKVIPKTASGGRGQKLFRFDHISIGKVGKTE